MITKDIQTAIDTVRRGGILIYPTDTAYGIGCRIDRPDAVDRLLQLRRRPSGKPVPILVSSIGMGLRYFSKPPPGVCALMDTYWPGALTIVYFAQKDRVYSTIAGPDMTVGIRMPDHPVPLRIISETGVPLVGTSANFSGQETPFEPSGIHPDLAKNADCVIYGDGIGCIVSTVLDCTSDPFKILRQGGVRIV